MSAPFARKEREIESRFRDLGHRLNEELKFRDQRLRFTRRQTRRSVVEWHLDQAAHRGSEMLPHRTACAIAESANGAALYLAYSEHWMHVGKRDLFRFRSSWMRLVIASMGLERGAIQLRLEWEARWQNREGGFEFPGHGAAHPHWQIDLDALASHSTTSLETVIDLENTQPSETIDLGAQYTPTRHPSRWFHKLHLPARAMWHEQPCVMPDKVETQQHEPKGFGDIDNWVMSAIRYLRYEFSSYS